MCELFNHIKDTKYVFYVDFDYEDNDNKKRDKIISYLEGEPIKIEDFYKKLDESEYKDRIFNSPDHYDQSFCSIIACKNTDDINDFHFLACNYSWIKNRGIKNYGRFKTYDSVLRNDEDERVINEYDDIPFVSMVIDISDSTWLEYAINFNIYYMENPFINDDFINDNIEYM